MSDIGLGMVTGSEPQKAPEVGDMPPLTTDEKHVKGTPHHFEERVAALTPELKELFEKTMADKVNAERAAKIQTDRLAATERKLNEIVQKEQEAERQRLAEQGEYKKLAEQAQAELASVRAETARQVLKDKLNRELLKAGALDEDLLSAGLLSTYGTDVTIDNAGELVSRLMTEKPLLFKTATPNTTMVNNQTAKATGVTTNTPAGGNQPTPFNATDKKIPVSDVERAYREAMKNASF